MNDEERKQRAERIAELRALMLAETNTRLHVLEYWGLREEVYHEERAQIEERITENSKLIKSRRPQGDRRTQLWEEREKLNKLRWNHRDQWERRSYKVEEGFYPTDYERSELERGN